MPTYSIWARDLLQESFRLLRVLGNVYVLIPAWRQTYFTGIPAYTCFKILTISDSVNRDLLIESSKDLAVPEKLYFQLLN